MNFQNKFSTQIGGKYSKLDNGVFNLKKFLEDFEIEVNFPESNNIVSERNGIELTFEISDSKNFFSVEKAFFQSIKNSSFHIVCNQFLDNFGYLGYSSSIEVAYAILRNKPLIFLYPLKIQDSVPNNIRNLILDNYELLNILNITQYSKVNLYDYLNRIYNKKYIYNIDIINEISIMYTIKEMFDKYKLIV